MSASGSRSRGQQLIAYIMIWTVKRIYTYVILLITAKVAALMADKHMGIKSSFKLYLRDIYCTRCQGYRSEERARPWELGFRALRFMYVPRPSARNSQTMQRPHHGPRRFTRNHFTILSSKNARRPGSTLFDKPKGCPPVLRRRVSPIA